MVLHTVATSPLFLAAKGASLSEKIHAQDLGGEDPLPKYLAHVEVSFGSIPRDEKDGSYLRSRIT
jgi:hypothetical protein